MLRNTVEARYLDHYSYLNSPIHRLGAHTKLAIAIAMVFLVLLIPIWWYWFHAVVWLMLLVTALVSRIPLGGLLKRLRWVWVVLLVISLGRLWQEDGLYRFLSAIIKGSECLVTMVLLANTTRFTDLLQVIAALQAPRIFVTTLSLMYRYLFVLTDEKNRMLRARRSRTFRQSNWWVWLLQSNLIANLFVRCAERASRIHAAMLSRGMQ